MKASVLVATLLLFSVNVSALEIGKGIPSLDVKMPSTKGKTVTLREVSKSHKNQKGTLVVFSCVHCPYAKKWDQRIAAIGAKALEDGVGVVMINSNDPARNPEDGIEGMKKRTYEFPFVVDETSKVALAFGATKTPEVFLFDASGKLAYKGAVDDNYDEPDKVEKHYLKEALASVVAKKPVAKETSIAVGCGIKLRKEDKG